MRSVVKEVKTRDQLPIWQVSSITLVFIIIVNILITSSNRMSRMDANIFSLSILVLAIAVFAYIIYKRLVNYIYILDGDMLIFKKAITEGDNTKLTIDQDEIEWIKPIEEIEKTKGIKKTYKFVFKKDKSKTYVGQFKRKDKKYRFLFEPDKKLQKALNLGPIHKQYG